MRVLAEPFGAAEVTDLDPADASSRAAAGAILREALSQCGVVCVRSSTARSDAEMRALASMIGPVKDPVGRTRDGAMLRYGDDRQIIDAGFVLTDELRAELGDVSFGGDSLRPGLFETFHTDDSYTERPAAATVLHARELPVGPGGDTCFIDMRAAFRLLDARAASAPARTAGRSLLQQPRRVPAARRRPRVRSNSSSTSRIRSFVRIRSPVSPRSTSISTARRTSRGCRRPKVARCCSRCRTTPRRTRRDTRTHGSRHDVLVWDNASVQHKASGDFPVGEPRRFWRYMIEGPLPAAFAPAPGHGAA